MPIHVQVMRVVLTHVASQLTFRYLKIETDHDAKSDVMLPNLASLSTQAWHDAACEWALWFMTKSSESAPTPQFLWDQPDFIKRLSETGMHHCRALQRIGAHLLILGGQDYPGHLAAMPDPPLCISVLGRPDALFRPTIGIVGSRKATPRALLESFRLGRQAAVSGYTVISGGAFGCDIAAHRGVLDSGVSPCPAAVVMAGGLDSLYPRAHRGWFREIQERGGAVISERLWWAASKPHDFIVRNRIIAGLSQTLCLMQATKFSGALTTARLALDQGREVVVLEHPTDDVRYEGNQMLAFDGAATFSSMVCLNERGLLH